MNIQNILVTGAKGQLGSELQEIFPIEGNTFFFTDIVELDICKVECLDDYLQSKEIDVIINCAAYTAVDKAEEDKQTAEAINTLAVENLVKISNKYNILLIHISTDFVFDGSLNRPYTEEDIVNPISVYGKTKLKGEEFITNYCKKYFIIRTSWLYSSYGNNFVKNIIKLAKERENLKVIFDQVGTPTYAKDLAETIVKLTLSETKLNQIFHYSNEGVASWYDFASSIIRNKKINCNVLPISTKEYPTPAARPKFSVLDKTKIKKELNITIPHWEDSLNKCLSKLQ